MPQKPLRSQQKSQSPNQNRSQPNPPRKNSPVSRLAFDHEILSTGYKIIAGVDEVGRGCLAGPVVAAACILPLDVIPAKAGIQQSPYFEIRDSKLLSPKKREELSQFIQEQAVAFAFGVVSPEEIDRINILQATLRAMKIAIEQLPVQPDSLLVDGNQKVAVALPQRTITGGDDRSLSIGAASILAKVYRDRMML
ncbi:MAG: ribonuclease HII, partial [Deltaproteobacteria bacterium]|nr:ribonuclease HII [Deltaproteobacteria bacterium]